jgi:hypothetical protein
MRAVWSSAGCAAVGSAAAALGVSPLESPDDVEANPLCVASGAARLLAPVLTECEVRSDPVLCVPVVVPVVAAADGPIPAAGAVVAVGAEPAAVWFTEPEAGLGTGLVPDAGWAVATGAACEPLAGVACPPVAEPALAAGSGVM